jgi:putative spermidine/putrescine transport system substrate-binding protein
MKRLSFMLLSVLLIIAVFLSACSPAQQPTQAQPVTREATATTAAMDPTATTAAEPTATTAAANADWNTVKSAAEGGGMDALIAAAKAEGELNVITLPRDWCNYGELMDTFTQKYGIKVNSLNPDGGSADEIQAVKDNKDNKGPQAPDVLDIGPAYGPLGKSDNLLAAYKVQTWDTINGVKDPDGYFFTDYNGVLVFEVNTDVIKDVPQDYSDLLDAKYKGQIALAGDPRASNQAAQSVYAATLANGGSLDNVQPGLDFFKKLNQAGNLLPLIADSGPIAKGETPITFQWNYLAAANKDTFAGNPNIAIVYPKSVNWGGYYFQAISAYAPHAAAARLWEEFLYSDEGHLLWMKGYCAPARLGDMLSRGVVPDELKAKLPDPELIASSTVPNGDQLSKARAAIKEQWDSIVGLDIKGK